MVPDSSSPNLCTCCGALTMSFFGGYSFCGSYMLPFHLQFNYPHPYPQLAVQWVVFYSANSDRTLLVSDITCLFLSGNHSLKGKSPIYACCPCLLCLWVINTLQTTHISLKAEDYHKVASIQYRSCNNKRLCYLAAQKASINQSSRLQFPSIFFP